MATEIDGIQSAILVATGGSWASPTGWTELVEAVDNLDVPDNYDETQLKGRHTRDGNRSIRGARHLADSIDIDFEWDEDATLCQFLRTAFVDKTTIIVAFVPQLADYATPALPTTDEYVKAEYYISGLDLKHNPGSANTRMLKLRQGKGMRAVKVIPS